MALDQAIAQFEGYNTPGTPAARNNNPGNVRSCAGQVGTSSQGFAILPDASTGWACLDNWIANNSNLTLQQAVNKYLGVQTDASGNIVANPDNNNPNSYLNFLVSQTGLQPSDSLSLATASMSSGGDTSSSVDTSLDTSTSDGSSSSFDLSTLSLPVLVGGAVIGAWMIYTLIRG